jgi:sterol desaturase/sphingolipid hydroxylase (fatty acid hydroxylase superfamily)
MEPLELFGLLSVPVTYAVMLVIERLYPARTFPDRPGWQWTGLAFLIVIMSLGVAIPLLLPMDWLEQHRWIDGTRLGVVGGTIAGYVLLQLAMYAWHRTAHNVDFLWRTFHQIHHSPQRVDIPGSALFHPLEVVVTTAIQLFVTVIVLGLDPIAAAAVGYLFAFGGMFQHWNIRTPQWIGYVLQRPESHCVHHRRGVHYYNYADLATIDLLFGTWRNPKEYRGECGFDSPADAKVLRMLALQDANAPLYGPGSRGAKPTTQAA